VAFVGFGAICGAVGVKFAGGKRSQDGVSLSFREDDAGAAFPAV